MSNQLSNPYGYDGQSSNVDELESSNLELLKTKMDDLIRIIDKAFTDWGLDVGVQSVHLVPTAKVVLKCPPGYAPSHEAIQHPDGTVSYVWVCKKL